MMDKHDPENIPPARRGGEQDTSVLQVTTPEERKRAFRVLFASLVGLGMGQTLFFAILPPIARDLGLSEQQTQSIFALSALLWVLFSPFWGRRSDTMGRKPVIIIGLLGFGVSTTGFALIIAGSLNGWVSVGLMFPMLIGVRAVFGTFGSGTHPASQAYVADRTTREERTAGVAALGAAFGIGTVIGPGFAAALASLHILLPFFAVAAIAFGGVLAIWLLLPERTPPKSVRNRKRVRLSLLDPRVMPLLVTGVVLSFAQSIVMQTTTFYLQDKLELTQAEAIQLAGAGFMVMALATLFAQIGLIQRLNLSVQFLLRWGSGICLLSSLMLAAGNNYATMLTALALAGVGFGFMRPGLQAKGSLSVSSREQGAIAGIIGGTAATGHILNPVFGAPLYLYFREGPFLLAAVLMGGLLLYILFHPRIRALDQGVQDEDDSDVLPH